MLISIFYTFNPPNFPDCDFKQGQGGWSDWSERKDPDTGKITFVQSSSLYTDYRYRIIRLSLKAHSDEVRLTRAAAADSWSPENYKVF